MQWFTDNRYIPSIIRSGSMKRDLHQLALSIFKIVIRNSIDLQIDWIPRSFNDHADAISRIIDFDDWGVSLEFFNYIDHIWGPHTVDCFANFNSASLPGSIPVIGTRTQRVWMLFVMTGEGRIIPCPPGNKAICRVPT